MLVKSIWAAAEQLSPAQRKIFRLLFFEGLTPFEIAGELKISVDTVKVQKAKALHRMREVVRRKMGAGGKRLTFLFQFSYTLLCDGLMALRPIVSHRPYIRLCMIE